jgi:hypothetical protein
MATSLSIYIFSSFRNHSVSMNPYSLTLSHIIQGLEDGKIRIVNIEDESPVGRYLLLSCPKYVT